MMTRFRTLAEDDLLDTAMQELLAGDQQDFPVLRDGRLAGLLRRGDLIASLRQGRRRIPVAEVMTRQCGSVEDSALLEGVFREMHRVGCTSVPVLRRGELVGLVSLENIGEWLMIQSAVRDRAVGKPAASAGIEGTDRTHLTFRQSFGILPRDAEVLEELRPQGESRTDVGQLA
jgi:signal-transduction protein with cAMP-binding, CBS, and nucleotidyltransferase domain